MGGGSKTPEWKIPLIYFFFCTPSLRVIIARSDHASHEQPKGILKPPTVRFPSKDEDGNSSESSDEEKAERRKKTVSTYLV